MTPWKGSGMGASRIWLTIADVRSSYRRRAYRAATSTSAVHDQGEILEGGAVGRRRVSWAHLSPLRFQPELGCIFCSFLERSGRLPLGLLPIRRTCQARFC